MYKNNNQIYGNQTIEKTDHPHIIKVKGVAGGEPIISGTRMMVRTIIRHYQLESSIEEILWNFPHLSSAQVHDAISYYHDHRDEMNIILERATYEYWQPIIEKVKDERAKDLSE